jgi:hypothetical protein
MPIKLSPIPVEGRMSDSVASSFLIARDATPFPIPLQENPKTMYRDARLIRRYSSMHSCRIHL